MNRRIVIGLIVCLVIGVWAGPVQAQAGGPPLRASVHIVQRGETMSSIAQRYGLTADAVTHANGLPDPRRIYIGQRLAIPGAREITLEETAPYVVQAGDTLVAVARRYHTTWQILVRVNGMLSPDALYVGQVIQVPAPPASPPTGGTEGGSAVHVVRSDDTLLRVALRHDVSFWTLAVASRVANPALIYPGQELLVPGEGPSLLPKPFISVEIQPLPATQGTTMVVAVRTTKPVRLKGRLFEREAHFVEESSVYYGLVGVGALEEPGLYELDLSAVDGEGHSTRITADVIVETGRFGYERIDPPASRTSLLEPAVIAADRERLNVIRQTFTQDRRWNGSFKRPCGGNISSYFGTHRAYNGGPYTSYHSGVDFRATGGTPVYASAAGTVLLAEPLALYGNLIVLDHGWGLLTGYGHLSSFEVQVGQHVAQGDLIGRVGNTGLSTGAHLHWEVWVGGVSVSGLQWLEEFYPWPERLIASAATLQRQKLCESCLDTIP